MKWLSVSLVLTGLLALAQPGLEVNTSGILLAAAFVISAVTTHWSTEISSLLQIFVGIFPIEAMISGLVVIAGRRGLWPTGTRCRITRRH